MDYILSLCSSKRKLSSLSDNTDAVDEPTERNIIDTEQVLHILDERTTARYDVMYTCCTCTAEF